MDGTEKFTNTLWEKKFLAYLSVSTVEEMKHRLFSINMLKAHLFCGMHITCAHIHTEWLTIHNMLCYEKVIDFSVLSFQRMYCRKFTNCFEHYLFLIVLNVFYLMTKYVRIYTYELHCVRGLYTRMRSNATDL